MNRSRPALVLLALLAPLAVALPLAVTLPSYAADPVPDPVPTAGPAHPDRPARPATFTRVWSGHTRGLEVGVDPSDPTGVRRTATEEVGDGCCTPVLDLTLALDGVRGTRRHGSIGARVVSVTVRAPAYFDSLHPAPSVGDTTRLRLRDGVLHEPLSRTTYCDGRAGRAGRCGA